MAEFDVKWIKLSVGMFEDEKIDFIQSLPEGDAILNIWIRLLTMAGKCNAGGFIFLTQNIPYTEDALAYKFKKPVNVVKLALKTFQGLDMVDVKENGLIYISNFPKHQNMEGLEQIKKREQEREKKAKYREKLKEIQAPSKEEIVGTDENVPGTVPGTNEGTSQGQSMGTPSIIEAEVDKEDITTTADETPPVDNVNSVDKSEQVIKMFDENIQKSTPLETEQLKKWCSEVEPEVVVTAITEAVMYNAKNMAYINSLIISWKGKGITTKVALDAYKLEVEKEKAAKKSKQQGKKKQDTSDGMVMVGERKYDINKLEKSLLGRTEDEGG